MRWNRRSGRVAVVVGVLLVAAAAVALLVRSARARALVAADARRLSAVGMVAQLYANDHGGAYPDTLTAGLHAEEQDTSFAFCMASDQSTADTRLPYVYLGRFLTAETVRANTVLAYSPPAYTDGRGANVLFGDGRVVWASAADLPAVLARGGPATRPATGPSGVPSDHG